MFRITAIFSVLVLTAVNLRAADAGDPPPCGQDDFTCIQERETERFQTRLADQKEAWLGHWEEAKKRGESMLKKQKLSCGELSGMERMKCRIEAAKKLKDWKEKHEAKKDEYIGRMEKMATDFGLKQEGEDKLWNKVKNDFSDKAQGIKDKLLGGNTVASFLGPMLSGQSLESQVNAAVQRGAAGAGAAAGDFVKEHASHFEKLKTDRDACRSTTAVGSCLEQVGIDHDKWKSEFETRKKQAEEAVKGFAPKDVFPQ